MCNPTWGQLRPAEVVDTRRSSQPLLISIKRIVLHYNQDVKPWRSAKIPSVANGRLHKSGHAIAWASESSQRRLLCEPHSGPHLSPCGRAPERQLWSMASWCSHLRSCPPFEVALSAKQGRLDYVLCHWVLVARTVCFNTINLFLSVHFKRCLVDADSLRVDCVLWRRGTGFRGSDATSSHTNAIASLAASPQALHLTVCKGRRGIHQRLYSSVVAAPACLSTRSFCRCIAIIQKHRLGERT